MILHHEQKGNRTPIYLMRNQYTHKFPKQENGHPAIRITLIKFIKMMYRLLTISGISLWFRVALAGYVRCELMVAEFLLTQVTCIIVKGLWGEKDLILLIF